MLHYNMQSKCILQKTSEINPYTFVYRAYKYIPVHIIYTKYVFSVLVFQCIKIFYWWSLFYTRIVKEYYLIFSFFGIYPRPVLVLFDLISYVRLRYPVWICLPIPHSSFKTQSSSRLIPHSSAFLIQTHSSFFLQTHSSFKRICHWNAFLIFHFTFLISSVFPILHSNAFLILHSSALLIQKHSSLKRVPRWNAFIIQMHSSFFIQAHSSFKRIPNSNAFLIQVLS